MYLVQYANSVLVGSLTIGAVVAFYKIWWKVANRFGWDLDEYNPTDRWQVYLFGPIIIMALGCIVLYLISCLGDLVMAVMK